MAGAMKAIDHDHRLLGFFGTKGGHLPYQTADGQYNPTIDNKEEKEHYLPADLTENPTLAEMTRAALLVLEQGSYLAVGLLLWLSAFGGTRQQRRERAPAGIAGLLLTSMHMTLLGVLLALAGRPLYLHAGPPAFGLSPLQDQHLGGVIMLVFGGISYLLGGLLLLAGLLRKESDLASAR